MQARQLFAGTEQAGLGDRGDELLLINVVQLVVIVWSLTTLNR